MTEHQFVQHTVETAPQEARRLMETTTKRMGYLPAAVGLLAESPQLLEGFFKLSAMFETSTLDSVAREVLIMTMATRNGCHLCVAMHTAKLVDLGADAGLIAALRDATPLADRRLDAVRVFTLHVLATTGAVGADALRAFLDHGYTRRNALEIVLGIGAYTMSTFANRLTEAPLDDQLAPFAWAA